ncbi:hypothetical protein PCANC_04706 [Puccinia coronata f. sp. avenae]|uniref:CxC1-like cysteine cluster associated with KDZ transposases domain-containing protein n=1 Tax=Puccinia coronata f. sp. avenae TaxID=200324 RepID=A0A2N5W1Q3_9BASI|nr:hypothetical protein PCANC_04706 [Puccinia coronata f. sp. avenae]
MQIGNPPDFAEDYSADRGGYDGPSYWKIKQQKKLNNWSDLFGTLFPAYTHLKRITNDWTSPDLLDNKTHEICSCQKDHCSTQHKAADDKRNASTWKGCKDTGLMEAQQRSKILVWSAKSALFKAAVEIQAETQPLRASKERGQRIRTRLKEKIYAAIKRQKNGVVKAINTFCKRRKKYLSAYTPEELQLTENQDFDYQQFMKMGLDHPFWNNGYLCLSREPWAVDPVVRTGIHATLGLERSREEIQQLQFELRRSLLWGIFHLERLQDCINKTIERDSGLDCVLDDVYGDFNTPGVQNRPGGRYLLLGGDLWMYQVQHEELLWSWHFTLQGMLEKKLITQEIVPAKWFNTIERLIQPEEAMLNSGTSTTLDAGLEDVALDNQDSNGENNQGPTEDDVVTDDEDGELINDGA